MEDIPRAAVTQEAVSMTGWILSGIAAVIATLSGAVSYLFFLRNSEIQKAINDLEKRLEEMTRKADECHEQRAQIHAQCQANTVRIEFLTKELEKLQRGEH